MCIHIVMCCEYVCTYLCKSWIMYFCTYIHVCTFYMYLDVPFSSIPMCMWPCQKYTSCSTIQSYKRNVLTMCLCQVWGRPACMKMITNLVVLPLCMTHTRRDLPKCGWCVSSLLSSGGWSESEGPVYDARPAGYECWWKVETIPLISSCLPTFTHSLRHFLPSANTHWPIISPLADGMRLLGERERKNVKTLP